MECTQRLECTEDLCSTQREEVIPEQVGYLGICGQKYPVVKGPNKIGRDPSCKIILNLNSVSRHHAIINVVNNKNIMLMDLDSSNKTKLLGKILPSYIPQQLQNGDTVQFGDVFGIFRMLDEIDELPETQAIDVPETPLPKKHVSRINGAVIVPESPDVSDKDDSFILASQPKGPQIKSTITQKFVKPGRTISILPVGNNRIDNIYWNSSKKSTSFNLDDSAVSLNDSLPPVNLKDKENIINTDIHELATQLPPGLNLGDKSTDSIFAADTQIPKDFETSIHPTSALSKNSLSIHVINTQIPDAELISVPNPIKDEKSNAKVHINTNLYELETQLPPGHNIDNESSDPIYDANTQIPEDCIQTTNTQIPRENLPEVCKIIVQQDIQLDLCAEKCESGPQEVQTPKEQNIPDVSSKVLETDKSDDDVLFDELEESFEEGFESQAILTEDIELPMNNLVEPDFEPLTQIVLPKSAKRNMRILSDGSSDVEAIDISIQNITKKKAGNEDTDCEEDNLIEIKTNIISENAQSAVIKDVDLEDIPTQVIVNNENVQSAANNDVDFEDMPTQVIVNNQNVQSALNNNVDLEDVLTQVIVNNKNVRSVVNNDVDLEDMPTQVIVNNENLQSAVNNDVDFEDMLTQVIVINDNIQSATKNDVAIEDMATQVLEVIQDKSTDDGLDIADQPTQILVEDKSSKNLPFKKPLPPNIEQNSSLFKMPSNAAVKAKKKEGYKKLGPLVILSDDKTVSNDNDNYYQLTQDLHDDLCSQRLDVEEIKSNETSMCSKGTVGNYLNNVSNQDSLETTSNDNQVVLLRRKSSESSSKSAENTPKKQRPLKLMDIDLPNSQEIETTVSQSGRVVIHSSSSESDIEENSEDQYTPIVYRKKKKTKPDARLNLTNKLDLEALPTRVITRVRKPTTKVIEHQNNKATEILKPKFLTEQEGDIDKDIIIENITRLKSKHEKSKNVEKSSSDKDSLQTDNADNTHKNIKIPVENTVETGGKKIRSCRKKAEESISKLKFDKGKESVNESKVNERKTRETRSNKKYSDSKKESLLSGKRTDIKDVNQGTTASVEDKRSSRTRDAKTMKTKEKTPEKDKNPGKYTRTYTRNAAKNMNIEKTKEPSPEKEICKRKRGRPAKDDVNKVTDMLPKKRDKKESETSVVYEMSSSLNAGSKRHCLDDSDVPSAKRTRSSAVPAEKTSIKASGPQCVLFTGINIKEVEPVESKLKELGVVTVTDIQKCTVVLTLSAKRTVKMLCAIGLGKPIVGLAWVQACHDNNCVVDPWQYLLKDEVSEKRFHFSLENILKGPRNFLKGYSVSSTPSVEPKPNEMKMIVECSGGKWVEGGPRWICISTRQDFGLWPALQRRGATIASTEFIFMGVLQQKVLQYTLFEGDGR